MKTLKTLLEQYHYIEIPRLQRDYAQGRRDERGVINTRGANFVRAIFESLVQGEHMKLDFVYASLRDGKLIPLDGQQRLTTLFLLYWYLAQKEEGYNSEHEISKLLKGFTYDVRETSRQFIERLTSLKLPKGISPGGYIRDQVWFLTPYLQDPTVLGMLTMLDYIHSLWLEHQSVQLSDLERIGFHFLSLEDYGLTDDLYIKMNARGRELSPYEHLKADFIRHIKGLYGEQRMDYEGRNMRCVDAISLRLDNRWLDLVWRSTRSNEGRQDDFDLHYLRLFNRYCYSLWIEKTYIHERKPGEDTEPEGLKRYQGRTYRNFDHYEELFVTKELIDDFVRIIDVFAEADEREKTLLDGVLRNPWAKGDDSRQGHSMKVSSETLSSTERVALYALFLYLRNNVRPLEEQSLIEWMRIAWNLAINPSRRKFKDNVVEVTKVLYSLSSHSGNIEPYLLSLDEVSDLLQDEVRKVKYLSRYPKRREALVKLERSRYLNAQVDFVLDYEVPSDSEFCEAVDLILSLVKEPKQDDLWIRATLALQTEPLDSSSIYLGGPEGDNVRTSSILNNYLRTPFLQLLRHLSGRTSDIQEAMKKLCQDYRYRLEVDWLYPLVKYPLLRRTSSYYVKQSEGYWTSDYGWSGVVLMHRSRWAGYRGFYCLNVAVAYLMSGQDEVLQGQDEPQCRTVDWNHDSGIPLVRIIAPKRSSRGYDVEFSIGSSKDYAGGDKLRVVVKSSYGNKRKTFTLPASLTHESIDVLMEINVLPFINSVE